MSNLLANEPEGSKKTNAVTIQHELESKPGSQLKEIAPEEVSEAFQESKGHCLLIAE